MRIKEVFGAILEKTRAGEDTVLATIVAENGSGPRSAGAHMLVDTNGRVCGTIGGGTLEYRAVQFARDLLEKRESRAKTYRLYQNDEEDLGMMCGGDVEVYFQFIPGGDEKTAVFMEDCLAGLEKDTDLWLLIDMKSPADWAMTLCGVSHPLTETDLSGSDIFLLTRHKGVLLEKGGRRIYGEPVNTAGKVVIFGGGHVAQALQPLLASIGFRCVIFDNREDFVKRELFPSAWGLITGDYDKIEQNCDIRFNDYIVIATHSCDLAVLRQVIHKDCAYIGVIGSKTKAEQIKRKMFDEGISVKLLNRVNIPIGLPIKSETPEEIAVSIAGELILRRAERRSALY